MDPNAPPAPDSDPARDFALGIVSTLRREGHVAYFAGGCVRDELLGRPPTDYDVATDATPRIVQRLFRRTVPVGVQFGVVVVVGPGGIEIEVATFRSDGRYADGRHPEDVRYGNEKDDALRRDFTINGLFLDPESGRVVDHVGGREDLERRVLRAIGVPEERFQEDKLRLLRGVRFTSELDLELDPGTRDAMVRHAPDLSQVSAERLGDELAKLLSGRDPAGGVRLLAELGLLSHLVPEIGPESGDRWDETLAVLGRLRRGTVELGLAALLHLAEPDSARCAATAGEVGERLRYSRRRTHHVRDLVEQRDTVASAPTLAVARRRRLLADPLIEDHLRLLRLRVEAGLEDGEALRQLETELEALGDDRALPPGLVDGNDLLELGVPAGPRIREILEVIQDRQLEGTIAGREEALEVARSLA